MTEFTIPNYFDANEPNSLVCKLPENIALMMIERRNEIIRGLAKENMAYAPPKTVNHLRKNLWIEYENAVIDERPIALSSLIKNVCTPSEYYALLRNSDHWVWMLRPLISYRDSLEETLSVGLDRLRDIVTNMKIMDPETKDVDYKAAKLLLSAIKMIDDRLNGQAVQKVESKNLNVQSKADELFYSNVNQAMKELEVDETPVLVQKQISANVFDYLTKVGSGKEKN